MAGQEHDQRHILRHPVLGGCRLGCQAGCGILPALVLWVRIGINESPRYERVTAQMVRQELKKQFDIFSSFRSYPRESVIATLVYFLYRFKHTPTPSPRSRRVSGGREAERARLRQQLECGRADAIVADLFVALQRCRRRTDMSLAEWAWGGEHVLFAQLMKRLLALPVPRPP